MDKVIVKLTFPWRGKETVAVIHEGSTKWQSKSQTAETYLNAVHSPTDGLTDGQPPGYAAGRRARADLNGKLGLARIGDDLVA